MKEEKFDKEFIQKGLFSTFIFTPIVFGIQVFSLSWIPNGQTEPMFIAKILYYLTWLTLGIIFITFVLTLIETYKFYSYRTKNTYKKPQIRLNNF